MEEVSAVQHVATEPIGDRLDMDKAAREIELQRQYETFKAKAVAMGITEPRFLDLSNAAKDLSAGSHKGSALLFLDHLIQADAGK